MDPDARFLRFDHDAWGRLRESTPLTLDEADLVRLRGINERVSLEEVRQIYLPLSRLLNLYVAATQQLYRATDTFLGHHQAKVPYVIGIAGSVAVGKSTTARLLQALLSRWPSHPKVDLVTTDGFLYPNRELEARGLMHRKGFPESYDVAHLVRFLEAVKSGQDEVKAPIYSHRVYDIVEDRELTVRQPDIVIVEGLNVLQVPEKLNPASQRVFVSDFFDFSIFVDAAPRVIEQWYVERFLTLRETVFTDADSYFHRYSHLSESEARTMAGEIWSSINGPNLESNIQPTRERAHLILEKGDDHVVQSVRLRRL
ncbi:MAG: type I pantothenate kinase [Acidobacteriota bacterium]